MRALGRNARVAAAGGLGVAALTLALLAACLSDLPGDRVLAGSDAGAVEAGPIPTPPTAGFCGDGFIDIDAGESCDFGAGGAASSADSCSAACKVVCRQGSVWRGNDHCYQVSDAEPNLAPLALERCAGHVVTFASGTEFAFVSALADASAAAGIGSTSTFWVGLTTSANRPYVSEAPFEPGWSPTCSGCYARTADASGALPRAVFAADGGLLNEQCVAAHLDSEGGTFEQYPCQGSLATVVCEREPLGVQFAQCDAGVCFRVVATHNSKRYVYRPSAASPTQAAESCAALDGRLVVFHSAEEREQLWRQLSFLGEPPDRFWIGLTWNPGDGGETGSWLWDDGTNAAPSPMAPGASPWGDHQPVPAQPGQRAYVRHAAGAIDDTLARDDERYPNLPYVCEMSLGGTP